MQVSIYGISEGFLGLVLIAATLVLLNYTRKRVAQLPEDEKGAGKPLYVAAAGVLFLGLASLVLHLNVSYYPGIEYTALYYSLTMFGAFFLTASALQILNRNRLIVVPFVLLLIGVSVSASVVLLGFPDFLIFAIPGVLVDVLYVLPAGLFFYLTYQTRRVTSLSFAMLLSIYPLYPLFLAFEANLFIISLLITLRLLAPSLVIVAFTKPDLQVSGEYFGYGMSLSIVMLWISYIVTFTADILSINIIGLSILTIATAIGFGTGSYTYGRYVISRNPATLSLSLFFILGALGFLLVTLKNLIVITSIEYLYIDLTITAIAMMLLNISAFFALDWKAWSLVPVIIGIPALLYVWLQFPLHPDLIPMRSMIQGITRLVQTIIPIGLYLTLGRNIRKAGGKGYMRPLLLGIGIIFLIFGSVGGEASEILSATMLLIAYFLWWLGITGRADKMFFKE